MKVAVALLLFVAAACSAADSPGVTIVDPSIRARLVSFPDGLPDKLQATTIHAVGDVVAHPAVANADGLLLSEVRDLFINDGLTIANFECALSVNESDGSAAGAARPICDASLVPDLAASGIDVVSVANDRSIDRGREALLDNVADLASSGLAVVGAGENLSEAYDAAIVEFDGWRVAVIGVTAIGGMFATPRLSGTAPVERTRRVTTAIETAAEAADLVVVTVHWGRPLDRDPEQRDRDYADTLFDAGADVVFGHGPHRLQSFAVVDARPVFWSLGHFLWPVAETADADSAIARIEIAEDGQITVCMLPVTISSELGPQLDRDERCEAN